jgi:hypothetical protein
VWLLAADGGTIPHKPLPVGAVLKSGDLTYHASYLFPCSSATNIAAVVVRVDGELFVERLLFDGG